MALRVSAAFLSDSRPIRQPQDDRYYRLPEAHAQILRDVARGVEESDVGVCCSYLVDAMSGEGADFDEHALNQVESYVEQSLTMDLFADVSRRPVVRSWRAKLQRCRRALGALHHAGASDAVAILMVLHGYPDPLVLQHPELRALGPLGSLVRYVDVVEDVRMMLVRDEAAKTEGNGQVVDLARRRSVQRWADRAIGSSDALRWALVPFYEPQPVQGEAEPYPAFEARREARRFRREAHDARRAIFLSQARVEAMRMAAKAERAYHEAWLRSA